MRYWTQKRPFASQFGRLRKLASLRLAILGLWFLGINVQIIDYVHNFKPRTYNFKMVLTIVYNLLGRMVIPVVRPRFTRFTFARSLMTYQIRKDQLRYPYIPAEPQYKFDKVPEAAYADIEPQQGFPEYNPRVEDPDDEGFKALLSPAPSGVTKRLYGYQMDVIGIRNYIQVTNINPVAFGSILDLISTTESHVDEDYSDLDGLNTTHSSIIEDDMI